MRFAGMLTTESGLRGKFGKAMAARIGVCGKKFRSGSRVDR